MELVEGKSMRAMSAAAGLPSESVLRHGVQIASALARAHDRGVVHRDLKTTNIIVASGGLIKFIDFGLAKLAPTRVIYELESLPEIPRSFP
jgi:serine/threonine protein kinase